MLIATTVIVLSLAACGTPPSGPGEPDQSQGNVQSDSDDEGTSADPEEAPQSPEEAFVESLSETDETGRPLVRRPPPRGDEPVLDPYRERRTPDLTLLGRVPAPDIELVPIPAGAFEMGPGPLPGSNGIEPNPAHTVFLETYEIGRYPVTNEQYLAFVQDTGYRYPITWTDGYPEGRGRHPVAGLTWIDARLFAQWMNRKTGEPWHLPTEAQWEKAASWDPEAERSREHPWGDNADESRANVGPNVAGTTTAVDAYSPEGDSYYGVADMAGNIAEWTNSGLGGYPYTATDGRESFGSASRRGIRGSDYYSVLAPVRDRPLPSDWWVHLWGLRVARSAALDTAADRFVESVRTYLDSYNQALHDEYARRGQTDAAAVYYSRGSFPIDIINRFPEIPHDIIRRAVSDLETAIMRYQEDPASLESPVAWVHFNLAVLYSRLGEYERALERIEIALELDPNDPAAYRVRADIRSHLGDGEGAESDITQFYRRSGSKDRLIATRARAALAAGRPEEAIQLANMYFARALWYGIEDPTLLLVRGQAYEALGRGSEALSDYIVFLLWDPENPDAYIAERRLADAGINQ